MDGLVPCVPTPQAADGCETLSCRQGGTWGEAGAGELQLPQFVGWWSQGKVPEGGGLGLSVPLLALPRGIHGRDEEEGPGGAGLPELAAGAEHVVRGTARLWQGCSGGGHGVSYPNTPVPDPPRVRVGALQPHEVLWFTLPSAPQVRGSHVLSVPSEGRGTFPGAQIYHMVEQVNGHLKESILKALEEER